MQQISAELMKFIKHLPQQRLRPYIKYLVVSESGPENEYKVLPLPGMVAGFQYKGQLSAISGNTEGRLASAGITGIADGHKLFKNSADTGTVLVYFTETGFTHFAAYPANELFDLSLSLEDIFDSNEVAAVEEELSKATTDLQRIEAVERFFLMQLKDIRTDRLIKDAIQLIYRSKGTIRIKELNEKLYISKSPFEKRFRKIVGTTAKKFASIIRFNSVLENMDTSGKLPGILYEHDFFDQAHFIKDFKRFTGETPEHFRRFS